MDFQKYEERNMPTKEQIPVSNQVSEENLLELFNIEKITYPVVHVPQWSGFKMNTEIKHLKEVLAQTAPGQIVKSWQIPETETRSPTKLGSITNKSPI